MAHMIGDSADRWRSTFPANVDVIPFGNEEEWKDARLGFICASETASVLGFGFESNIDVWRRKTGKEPKKKQKATEAALRMMEKGVKAEEHILELFGIENGYDMWSGSKTLIVNRDILDSNGNPFMACTLDGAFTDHCGKTCTLEIKYSESPRLFGDRPTEKYWAQVLKQMIVTGVEQACLLAHISYLDAYGKRNTYCKEYWFDTNDEAVRMDMETIKRKETEFWNAYVLKRNEPPMIMPNI